MNQENKELTPLQNKIGTVILVIVLIIFMASCSASSGSGGSSGKECPICEREFNDSGKNSNRRSITNTGMCKQCYKNYKYANDWLDEY